MKNDALPRAKATDGPNPVDVYVGLKVRIRRKFVGMSQEDLGEAIGLTFQQIQKYERGTNRISASKLFQIGKVLKTGVGYFFDGYRDDDSSEQLSASGSEKTVQRFLLSSEGVELAESFPRIANPKHRRRLLELVRTLADDSSEPQGAELENP